jgi:hypothetical protein
MRSSSKAVAHEYAHWTNDQKHDTKYSVHDLDNPVASHMQQG